MDEDSDSAMWSAYRHARQAKREDNRRASAGILKAEGVKFTECNNGVHLVVHVTPAHHVDFWPSTGLWQDRKTKIKNRGVRQLIKHCKEYCNGKV